MIVRHTFTEGIAIGAVRHSDSQEIYRGLEMGCHIELQPADCLGIIRAVIYKPWYRMGIIKCRCKQTCEHITVPEKAGTSNVHLKRSGLKCLYVSTYVWLHYVKTTSTSLDDQQSSHGKKRRTTDSIFIFCPIYIAQLKHKTFMSDSLILKEAFWLWACWVAYCLSLEASEIRGICYKVPPRLYVHRTYCLQYCQQY